MSGLSISQHGRQRLQQRGLFVSDVDLILAVGTETADGVVVLERDRDEAIQYLKNQMRRVEKVCGKRLVVRDGILVTAFHATKRQVTNLQRGQ